MNVEQLNIDQIMNLRVRVLRQGTPATDAHYAEDNLPGVVHIGAVHNGEVIGTSTWFAKQCPEQPVVSAYQLKGMAVDTEIQARGVGAQLVNAGIALAQENGASLIWARARDTAIKFYEKCGFTVVGEGFIDEATAMPHHIVTKSI